MEQKQHISLYELNKAIGFELNNSFDESYWIVAEINELKVNYSGHCYLEIIEKDKRTEAIIAKARATIWARTYHKLLPYFETTAQHAFCEGIKVMIKITVEFHELYGLSLNIIDIDPVYTLGDIQQQKQETIEKLKKDGVFNMNKDLPLIKPIQKIAVISSQKAAGYGDFKNQLIHNSYGFQFYYKLFPAIMQGENSEKSIIEALEKIYQYESFFDVVAIIRGGGSKTDLSCFDKYWLAYHVAQYPLPVITGIGHEQDDTITDMVACLKMKTPTAVASFLIETMEEFDGDLNNISLQIKDFMTGKLHSEKQRLYVLTNAAFNKIQKNITQKKDIIHSLLFQFKNVNQNYFQNKKKQQKHLLAYIKSSISNEFKIKSMSIEQYKFILKSSTKHYLKNQKEKLNYANSHNNAIDPQKVLNRGYSITLYNGKVLKNAKDAEINTEIKTRLKKGTLTSKIINKK